MLTLENLPAFKEHGLSLGSCSLQIQLLGEATTLDAAWKLLPDHGEGYVVCADSNRRFQPDQKRGLLMEAEVCHRGSTTMLRSDGSRWKAWKWEESPGDTHRWVEHTFLSSEPGTAPSPLRYRQYWTLQEELGLPVWRPVGARFCGFVQEEK